MRRSVWLTAAGLIAGSFTSTLQAQYTRTDLTADVAGAAANVDPLLVNPWGLAHSPGGPFIIGVNGSGMMKSYNGTGAGEPIRNPLSILFSGIEDPAPTGIVHNGGDGFVIGDGNLGRPARVIVALEGGQIAGWSKQVAPTQASVMIDNSGQKAVYKGLAIGKHRINVDGRSQAQQYLYATNFRAGVVELYDAKFQLVRTFTDPKLPDGYAPFGARVVDGKLYVTFALQDENKADDVAGPGNGFVSIFSLDGQFIKRLVSGGMLNSPWGLALAPHDFGPLSNALLVGNFGDGSIHAYNPEDGTLMGAVTDANGAPLLIPGLWALEFGNGGGAGPRNKLFFTAGGANESSGLFGAISAGQ